MFSQLKKEIRKFFGISKTEVNGIIVLIGILLIISILPMIYTPILMSHSNISETHNDLDSIWQILVSREFIRENPALTENAVEPEYFFFDPNIAEMADLRKLGFDSLLAARVIKYRNKGGKFNNPSDLMRIYGLSEQFYNKVGEWIKIENGQSVRHPVAGVVQDTLQDLGFKKSNDSSNKLAGPANWMNINQADSTDLIAIKGIGQVYAARIVRYRELLGGFYSLDQLGEIYGLKELTLKNLKESVYIDSVVSVRHIKVNFADWRELVRHPYISSDLANALINDRSAKGPFKGQVDLLRVEGIHDSLLIKIEKYLVY